MDRKSAPQEEQSNQGSLLHRSLGSWHVVAIIVSSMIGTGVFIRPASMMQDVGSTSLLLSAWLFGGVISLVLALCYAELATSMPEAGGEYVFLRAAFGELPAFMFGWMRFVVGAGIQAALAVGIAVFLSDLMPHQNPWWQWNMHLGAHHWPVRFGPKDVISISAIGLLAAANCVRVSAVGTVQAIFATLKVCVPTIIILGALAYLVQGHTRPPVPGPTGQDVKLIGFPSATLAALFAYNGWVGVTMIAGEVRNTGRRFARNIALGVGAVVLLYLLLNIAYVSVLPLTDFVSANSGAYPNAPSVGAKAVREIFGSGVATVTSLIFAVLAAGTLHANLLTIPRVFFSMAKDGLFFPAFARVHSQNGVPRIAVILFSLWIAVLALVGGFDRLTSMATFAVVLFYALNVVGLFVLRARFPAIKRPFCVPGYPYLPLAALVVVAWILYRIVARGAPDALAALVLLAIGLPVYGLFRWHRSRMKINNSAVVRSAGI